MNRPTDEQVNAAVAVIRQQYWADVRSIAEDAVAEVKAGRLPRDLSDGQVHDWVNETCDGNAWVIYTHNSRLLLVVTDNPGEATEALGDGVNIPLVSQAFYAMQSDVWSILSTLLDELGSEE